MITNEMALPPIMNNLRGEAAAKSHKLDENIIF
jgi:hypothetical protein